MFGPTLQGFQVSHEEGTEGNRSLFGARPDDDGNCLKSLYRVPSEIIVRD